MSLPHSFFAFASMFRLALHTSPAPHLHFRPQVGGPKTAPVNPLSPACTWPAPIGQVTMAHVRAAFSADYTLSAVPGACTCIGIEGTPRLVNAVMGRPEQPRFHKLCGEFAFLSLLS